MNNAFAYDLVPTPEVLKAALQAARRVNDFPTAVRIFEGTVTIPSISSPVCPSMHELQWLNNSRFRPAIKAKVENNQQYHAYLDELKPLREELGVVLAEDLYPEHVPRGR